MLADGTWIFLLEGLLALALAGLIVWWTLPRERHSGTEHGSDAAPPGGSTPGRAGRPDPEKSD